MTLAKFGPVVVLAVFTAACGSSPTAPSAAVDEASLAATSRLSTEELPAMRTACRIEAITLRTVPSTDRGAQSVGASFEGDPSNCAAPTWSTFPAARLVVNGRNGTLVTVYDDPANKLGVVDVTATVLVETFRVSETIRVSFPRGDGRH